MDINWSLDIYNKKTKQEKTIIVGCRMPEKYKKMMDDNKINPTKLLMRACEELDNSLRK